jgi:hypothetical protein
MRREAQASYRKTRGRWTRELIVALIDIHFRATVVIGQACRAPLQHMLAVIQKRIDNPDLTGGHIGVLVYGKSDEIWDEFQELMFDDRDEVSRLLYGIVVDSEIVNAFATLSILNAAACFKWRVHDKICSLPDQLFWFVYEDRSVDCPHRRRVAKLVLSVEPIDLDIVTRKIRALCFADIQFALHTGCATPKLYLLLWGIRRATCIDVQECEGLNSMIKRAGRVTNLWKFGNHWPGLAQESLKLAGAQVADSNRCFFS